MRWITSVYIVCGISIWGYVNAEDHDVGSALADTDQEDGSAGSFISGDSDAEFSGIRQSTRTIEGNKRQFDSPEHLDGFEEPLPVSHVLEKPLFHHQVHYIPKPYPVVSVQYLPKPVPVPVPVPPRYHVSHVHLQHHYHFNPCQNGGIHAKLPHDYFCICPSLFRGRHCNVRDYCASQPCMNGATCVETADSFRCICSNGFIGTVCEKHNPCYPSPCRNGGTCTVTDDETGFVCSCQGGFTGEHCEGFNRCDPNPCKNGGSCQQLANEQYQCICPPGFKGTYCTEPLQCYVNPCHNGGTCHEAENGYKCTCRIGYTGANCETHVCHPNPCYHGGHCHVESGHYKCICPPMYKGYACEIPNPCYIRPCLNNGVCIDSYSGYSAYPHNWDSGYLHYLCLCQPGFLGANCEKDVCKHCDVNAKCFNNTCVCIDGFFGDGFHCRKIPHPCHPNPCKNNGVCKELQNGEYDCVCPKGTTGKHCEDKDPCYPNPCQNNGKCIAAADGTARCICENGHTGANCESTIDPCAKNPCKNGGTCINDNGKAVCKCKGKWEGETCTDCGCPKGNKWASPPEFAQVCDPDGDCVCPGNLRKVEGKCIKGRSTNVCEPNPCKNGGTCEAAGETEFRCTCTKEWKGKTCEEPVCTQGYCLNNGICQAINGKPVCLCQEGCYGTRCEKCKEIKPTDPCHPNPCLNGGACLPIDGSYDCKCTVQYTGAHCEVDKCAKCDVRAVCVNGQCKCLHGYLGTGYECVKIRSYLCPVLCPVHSTCVHGACQCNPGYTMSGAHCVSQPAPCPAPCPQYSTCNHGSCQCIPGYIMNDNHCTTRSLHVDRPTPALPSPPPPLPQPSRLLQAYPSYNYRTMFAPNQYNSYPSTYKRNYKRSHDADHTNQADDVTNHVHAHLQSKQAKKSK